MSNTERTVGTVGALLLIIVGVWGASSSYSDTPTKDETKTIAKEQVDRALDTFKLRYGYEMYYLRRDVDNINKDVDTIKSEFRSFMRGE